MILQENARGTQASARAVPFACRTQIQPQDEYVRFLSVAPLVLQSCFEPLRAV